MWEKLTFATEQVSHFQKCLDLRSKAIITNERLVAKISYFDNLTSQKLWFIPKFLRCSLKIHSMYLLMGDDQKMVLCLFMESLTEYHWQIRGKVLNIYAYWANIRLDNYLCCKFAFARGGN
jgi:hypothetical protein